MERFEQFKNELLARAEAADACAEQYSRALHAETMDSLLAVVRDNFRWAVRNDVLTGEFIDEWKDEFAAGSIWHNCNVENGYLLATEGRVVAWDNSSVVARDNSSVEAWDNSSVVAWDNSSVVAWDNSSVVARDNSSVEARGNSSVEAWDNSSVVAWDNSSVVARDNSSVEAWDNSSVEAWDNSSVEAWDNSYTTSYDIIECQLNEHAIHRIRKMNTIRYADKNMKFELVEG